MKGMAKRLRSFRYNLVVLTEKLFPTDYYFVEYNQADLTCALHLPGGMPIHIEEWYNIKRWVAQDYKIDTVVFQANQERELREAHEATSKAEEMVAAATEVGATTALKKFQAVLDEAELFEKEVKRTLHLGRQERRRSINIEQEAKGRPLLPDIESLTGDEEEKNPPVNTETELPVEEEKEDKEDKSVTDLVSPGSCLLYTSDAADE